MDEEYHCRLSLTERRASLVASEGDMSPTKMPPMLLSTSASSSARLSRRIDKVGGNRPQPLPTPSRTSAPSNIPPNLLPSAPASPPTPAPSPTPHQRAPSWTTASEDEDAFLRNARIHFSQLDSGERQRFLAEVLNLCDSQQLSFVHNFVSPRLKKDPFNMPNE